MNLPMRATTDLRLALRQSRPIVRMAAVAAALLAWWWPVFAAGQATPVVSSFTNYMYAGGSINPLSLTPHTTWTGDVATLTYTNLTDPAPGLLWPWDIAGQTTAYWSDYSGFTGTDSFQWCAVNGSLTSSVATCFIVTTNCVPISSGGSWTGTS